MRARHGVRDRWPVFCETFTQWVIEDRFPLGRPAWERVGAQFVDDVAPYEFMKLRLLNASHLAVSGLGRLAGYVTIDESMADPRIAGIMAALMDRETGPTLPPVPGIDLPAYKRTLARALRQPGDQGHGRARQRRRAAERPGRPDPRPARGRARASSFSPSRSPPGCGACAARTSTGAPIPVRHPMAELLRAKAAEGGPDPSAAPLDPAAVRRARRRTPALSRRCGTGSACSTPPASRRRSTRRTGESRADPASAYGETTAVASISTRARFSTRRTTWTSAMAG